jgi:hypothetical protein
MFKFKTPAIAAALAAAIAGSTGMCIFNQRPEPKPPPTPAAGPPVELMPPLPGGIRLD